jgi:hypothetical protein
MFFIFNHPLMEKYKETPATTKAAIAIVNVMVININAKNKPRLFIGAYSEMVLLEGLEPTRLSAPTSQAGLAANYSTVA